MEKRFGARALTGLAVHSATFKGKAPLYGVLHLATHALAEDRAGRFSHLLFSLEKQGDEPDRLYVQDLYALKLPAQMVFLGACETGIGELKRGGDHQSGSRLFVCRRQEHHHLPVEGRR